MTRMAALAALGIAMVCCGLARLSPVAQARPPIVLKVATVAPAGSPTDVLVHAFAGHAIEVSAGQVQAKVFVDGTLGDEATTLRRLREGTVQASVISLEALAEVVPGVGVLLAPMLFNGDAHADRRLDGPVRKVLSEELAEHELVFGAWGPSELRGWLTRGVAMGKAKDAAGHVHPAPRSLAERMAATALGMQLSELTLPQVPDLTRTPVDVLPATPLEAISTGLDAGATHYLPGVHGLSASVLIYSKRWFDGLPEDAGRGLTDLPRELTVDVRKGQRAVSQTMLETLRARGVAVEDRPRAARKGLSRALRGVAANVAKELGPPGTRMLRAARGD